VLCTFFLMLLYVPSLVATKHDPKMNSVPIRLNSQLRALPQTFVNCKTMLAPVIVSGFSIAMRSL
jgi:hypothetical protein